MTTAVLIAAAMVALAALYVDTRCTRCGLYRHDHFRGMNPVGKRSFPTLVGRWEMTALVDGLHQDRGLGCRDSYGYPPQ
jgi:hypothetical protein